MKQQHSFTEGDPGRIFEERVLGKGITEINEASRGSRSFPPKDALKNALSPDVQRYLAWDPKNPHTMIAYDLLANVRESLRLARVRHHDEVELYSTLGTSLDKHHKTDFLFKFYEAIITVDLTSGYSVKKTETDTHIVLRPENLISFEARLETGARVARLLMNELKRMRALKASGKCPKCDK